MLSKLKNPIDPPASEAAVLLYKSTKIEEFIGLFPRTSSTLKTCHQSLPYMKEAVTDLAQTEKELMQLSMELKDELKDTLRSLERLQ
ncbi:hypothetical protein GKZ89_06255 [Bacillus mangrovi]|uniref:Uncharacterized protein n=1 Tax=Metabacillus mangrovi TaxID=1491830 RepID=A0A7X2V4G7_9BACI|nr:hypothetical protein [Metabacillus mangrovi]MTH53008.1 hypothetical protein [Metabacillus mangrovi]